VAIAPAALDALQRRAVDVIASSKTVQCFCQLLEAHSGAILDRVCIASIGPQTSKTCVSLLGRVDVEAEEYTLELIETLKGFVSFIETSGYR